MISFVLLLLLFPMYQVSPLFHETVVKSESPGVIPCMVNSRTCGDYHSIKWYKGNTRVAVYSPTTHWWRVEAGLKDHATVSVDDDQANLTFILTNVRYEGEYKCEIQHGLVSTPRISLGQPKCCKCSIFILIEATASIKFFLV